jgi:leukotriene-A4 hydrolase
MQLHGQLHWAGVTDPHSHTRPQDPRVRHLSLDLDVDFASRQLSGTATLELDGPGAADLVLDVWMLDLGEVRVDGRPTTYTVSEHDPVLGSALTLRLDGGTRVEIDYRTDPGAKALQWLDPPQTASGQPYLYTQSQPVLARSWVPLQDTPTVRFTYDATVRVPSHLMALMSAANPTALDQRGVGGTYHFTMDRPVPAYLLALAVGDLEFRSLGERVGVYAEPSVVDAAAWEFAELDDMMTLAESLYGPYRWARYDVLVLPPSFPYGGMENPRLTFATPTILARDRSLVSLIAHELAHSWSGNLVTNASWNDFWLNEGLTTYAERRIMEALSGKDYADMLAVIGRQDLDRAMADAGGPTSKDTALRLDIGSRDPDEVTGDVAYEKGALFLRMLEQSVGRARFDTFLHGYIQTFAFQSMDSDRFVAYLKQNLLGNDEALAKKLQIDAWVYAPGLPGNAPVIHSVLLDQVDQQLATFAKGTPAAQLQVQGWTTNHWLHFLRNLPATIDKTRMADIDAAFHFSDTGNSEILDEWLLRALRTGYDPAYPALERFLTSQGRRKFLQPLYTEMAKTPAGAEMALRIYEKARPGYHSVAQQAVDRILGWRQP